MTGVAHHDLDVEILADGACGVGVLLDHHHVVFGIEPLCQVPPDLTGTHDDHVHGGSLADVRRDAGRRMAWS